MFVSNNKHIILWLVAKSVFVVESVNLMFLQYDLGD